MNNEPRFILINADSVHKVINLNHVSAVERVPLVNSNNGNIIPDKFMTRLHMLGGQKFELYDAESSRIWELVSLTAFRVYP